MSDRIIIDKKSKSSVDKKIVWRNFFREIIVGLVILFILAGIAFRFYVCKKRVAVGVQAVLDLYNFNDIKDLDKKCKHLKTITTKEVYNKIAINNKDKSLNVYLKFQGKPTSVKIIKNNKNYVLYTLDTDSLTEGRMFLFLYDTNWLGNICYAREMEGIDFYNEDTGRYVEEDLPENVDDLDKALEQSKVK